MSQNTKLTPEDLRDVLLQLQEADLDVIVVGGQAINLWASYYSACCPELLSLQPFASEDLDFYGGRLEAMLCHEILGGAIALNRDFDPSPNAGVVLVDRADRQLRIDFLAMVFGLNESEISTTARTFVGAGPLNGLQLRVLHPLLCLEGKLSCLRDLPQQGRQDLKHVQMSVLIMQSFLTEACQQADPRPALKMIERVMGGTTREAGLRAWYLHGVFLERVLPLGVIRELDHPKWVSFLELRLPQLLESLKEKRQRYAGIMKRRLGADSFSEALDLLHGLVSGD